MVDDVQTSENYRDACMHFSRDKSQSNYLVSSPDREYKLPVYMVPSVINYNNG